MLLLIPFGAWQPAVIMLIYFSAVICKASVWVEECVPAAIRYSKYLFSSSSTVCGIVVKCKAAGI